MKRTTIGVIYDKSDERACLAFSLMKKHSGLYRITEKTAKCDACAELILDKNLAPESYRIKKENDGRILISGGDTLGLIYGAGRLLHRGYKEVSDEYCVPEKSVRSVYFATHFNNFYQAAPIDKITEYMEELVLWGCNCISMWFDMHHFSSMNDAEALELLERMRIIYEAAKDMGLKTALTMLANEYYYGAPSELLAENSTEGTGYFLKPCGFYNTEICPSKPEGEELILRARKEMLEYFSTTELDFVSLWPYDQGGCTCPDCRPWGSNGFIKISKKLAAEIRTVFPKAKCILSAWRFDSFTNGEWDGILNQLEDLSKHFDILMADFASPTTPTDLAEKTKACGMQLVGFPDISMLATPWGGFGAAPAPKLLDKIYQENESKGDGGFCYSEGIFEDINKVVMMSLYFGNSTASQAVCDYFRYYFSCESAEFAEEFVNCLEKSLSRKRINADGTVNNYPVEKFVAEMPRFEIRSAETVERAYELAKKLESTVPRQVKKSSRFQMLYLRAVIDSELVKSNGELTDVIEKSAKKLEKIYHAAAADYVVSPITQKAIYENRGHI